MTSEISRKKLSILTHMTDEAKELLDAEVRAAYLRGQDEERKTESIASGRAARTRAWLRWCAVLVFFALNWTYGLQLMRHLFPASEPIPPDIEALLVEAKALKDVSVSWQPFKEVHEGRIIYVIEPEPGVKCYSIVHESSKVGGCVAVP